MKKNTQKIIVGSGIAAAGIAAATAVSIKLTKKLVTVALDREQPKASKKMNTGCPAPAVRQSSLKKR
ncbi:MAG: hypothetical protein PUE85_02760 [Firmicutes bacterium]|nr:hypothetical protein [Bacillota bacterium]